MPEIAFAGRSNSGKSSLINTLLNLKSVKQLPTSARPGETQELAFLELPSLFIVDLPGYGFALAEEGRIKDWQEVTKSYLASRGSQVKRPNASGKKTLKRVLVLIDARVLIKQSDHQFMSFLDESGVKYQLVLTKCDLVGPEDLARRYEIVKQVNRSICRTSSEHIFLTLDPSGSGFPWLCQRKNPDVQRKDEGRYL